MKVSFQTTWKCSKSHDHANLGNYETMLNISFALLLTRKNWLLFLESISLTLIQVILVLFQLYPVFNLVLQNATTKSREKLFHLNLSIWTLIDLAWAIRKKCVNIFLLIKWPSLCEQPCIVVLFSQLFNWQHK